MPFWSLIEMNLKNSFSSSLKFEEESDYMNSLIFNKRLESMWRVFMVRKVEMNHIDGKTKITFGNSSKFNWNWSKFLLAKSLKMILNSPNRFDQSKNTSKGPGRLGSPDSAVLIGPNISIFVVLIQSVHVDQKFWFRARACQDRFWYFLQAVRGIHKPLGPSWSETV